jgi:hypothetical protein
VVQKLVNISLTQSSDGVYEGWDTRVLEGGGTEEKILQVCHLCDPSVSTVSVAVRSQEKVVEEVNDLERIGNQLNLGSEESEHAIVG